MMSKWARICFSLAMWLRIRKRRRKKTDPDWKESWRVLVRRYSRLARRYSKLELRYLAHRNRARRDRNEKPKKESG